MTKTHGFDGPGYISSGEYSVHVHYNLRSGSIYGNAVARFEVLPLFNKFSETAAALDGVKKTLFYGKGVAEREAELAGLWPTLGGMLATSAMSPDLFHGILGLMTETGEIAEATMESFGRGHQVDKVGLREEIGDCLWYLTVMAQALGTTLEECAKLNTAKLRKRYPDKFTEDAADNRDLAAEREVLEGGR